MPTVLDSDLKGPDRTLPFVLPPRLDKLLAVAGSLL
jgi:hypothetical protein